MGVKPRFKQAEIGVKSEWRHCDISDLCQLQRGFDITEATRKAGGIPVYTSSGLSYFHNEAKLQPPAVITGRKGILGKVFFVQEPCWPHDTTLWVKDFKGNDPHFVCVFLKQFKLERFDAATSVPTLNRNNLIGIPITIPPLAEQRAIAEALGDVDALLNALSQLIAKKRDIKKAATQQLLTGKIRLPGFTEGWKSDYVKNLAFINTGERNTQDKRQDGKYPFFVRSSTIEHIDSYSYDGEAVLTAGDGVGTGKIYHYIKGKFDFHQRVYKISDFSVLLDGYFFYLVFSTFFYDRIMSMTAKSSVDSVRREMIANMSIPLPSLQEQRGIALVLPPFLSSWLKSGFELHYMV